MPRPRAYVETTIPSAYHPGRESVSAIELREITRDWWTRAQSRFELCTSAVVLEELDEGPGPETFARKHLLDDLPVFTLDAHVIATAKELIRHKVMPAQPAADAYHLALAIHYDCAVLVTWDRKHLANPNKLVHVTRITERLGVTAPVIATPRELLRRMG